MLSGYMCRLYLDMETWIGSDEAIQERTEDALIHAWDQLSMETAHNLVDLMEKRIEAVIASRDWYT